MLTSYLYVSALVWLLQVIMMQIPICGQQPVGQWWKWARRDGRMETTRDKRDYQREEGWWKWTKGERGSSRKRWRGGEQGQKVWQCNYNFLLLLVIEIYYYYYYYTVPVKHSNFNLKFPPFGFLTQITWKRLFCDMYVCMYVLHM